MACAPLRAAPTHLEFPVDRRSFFGLATVPVIPFLLSGEAAQAQDEPSTADQIAETLGATMVAYVAESHINVGLIADGFAGEAIKGEQATALLQLCNNFLDQVEPRLTKLSKSKDLGDADKKAFSDTAELAKLIKGEASALEKFVDSEEDDDKEKYGKAREKAQAKLDKFFGGK